ncbi:MAG: ACP phosphodiesterase [Bacteroidia bacterium]|nr:ACP phosphodiesterase [Bacteroidia bacterium]MCX7651443.1 ACP phosphodiesterase [Bacteroidia bacterium]MDW8416802.1 ACP phosphodiesterase [Bacteroidia bacterium]
MHHLGHIFLAESPPGFRFGAFIADGVRARRFDELPPEVQMGVRFHRWVDWQTDKHPAFLDARRILRSVAGRYAGLIVDLWLDVALGENWTEFCDEPIDEFEERFRRETLKPYYSWAPPSWKAFMESINTERLLLRFGHSAGMLSHMERFILRRGLPLDSALVRRAIQQHEEQLSILLVKFWREAVAWRATASTFTSKL